MSKDGDIWVNYYEKISTFTAPLGEHELHSVDSLV